MSFIEVAGSNEDFIYGFLWFWDDELRRYTRMEAERVPPKGYVNSIEWVKIGRPNSPTELKQQLDDLRNEKKED